MKLNTTATKLITRTHIALYRRTGGKLGGRYRGSPVLLLTTTGRRSGQRRTMPLLYIDDGNRKVVAASYLGAAHHPAWYHNLLAQPEVTVQAGSSVQPMRAEVADPAERARVRVETRWTLAAAGARAADRSHRKSASRGPAAGRACARSDWRCRARSARPPLHHA